MRLLRIIAPVVALVALTGGLLHGQAQAPGSLHITALKVEPVRLTSLGNSHSEEVFIQIGVQYTGPDLLHISPDSFRLRDVHGQLHGPDSYNGQYPLKAMDLIGPTAPITGWLVFTLPTNVASGLDLYYDTTRHTAAGDTVQLTLAKTPVALPPGPDASRMYATDALQALQAYLVDESPAGGYVTLVLDPRYADGSGYLTPGDRAYLARLRDTLLADHRAFDAVGAVGAGPLGWKHSADDAFASVERDLVAIAARRPVPWSQWRATFAADDRALADLYQKWPSAQ